MRRVVAVLALGLVAPLLATLSLAGPAPAGAAAPRSDACGTLLAKPGGGTWRCSLVDHFSGSRLNRDVWVPQTLHASGGVFQHACYVDDPRTIAVGGGSLQLRLVNLGRWLRCDGWSTPYASGSVTTYRKFSQQYGRFEARIRTTATTQQGLQEAFWLWPDDRYGAVSPWPASGEIDIAENYSQYPEIAIPYLHYTANDNGGPVPGLNTSWNCAAPRGSWNTYTLTWSATTLQIDVNGRTCLVNTANDPAFDKRYIVALTQAMGGGTNGFTGSTPVPATMQVDYVKVWR